MLRGENVICGTSTTGTGTITFAATPSTIGALDFYQYLATDIGIANGKSVVMPYVIIEYTDSTYAKPLQVEKGVGTVAVGANLVGTTMARTTVQVTQTGTTYSDHAPSAISIGTAANVLVFPGSSAADIPAFSPYFENTLGDAKGLMIPWEFNPAAAGAWALSADGTSADIYIPFITFKPIVLSKASINVTTAYAGTTGVPVSTAYGRIYDVNSTGRPGNLIFDFGSFGTNPLNSTGFQTTGALSNTSLLPPSYWFFDLFITYTGATGSVTTPAVKKTGVSVTPGWLGTSSQAVKGGAMTASSGSSSTPNPANVTGYTWSAQAINGCPCIWLSST